jgi:hypothetical protein
MIANHGIGRYRILFQDDGMGSLNGEKVTLHGRTCKGRGQLHRVGYTGWDVLQRCFDGLTGSFGETCGSGTCSGSTFRNHGIGSRQSHGSRIL